MQRAHPAQAAAAPAHGFGPREIADGVFQHFGNNGGCGAALLFYHRKIDLPLFVIADF